MRLISFKMISEDVVSGRKKGKTIHYEKLPERIKIDFVIKSKKQPPRVKKFIHFLQKEAGAFIPH